MTLLKLLNLLTQIVDAVKEAMRLKRVNDFKKAKDAAIHERDNRIIEEAMGGSSGPSDPSKYPGMYERERKEPQE